jgi:hypothetical protein
LFLGLIITLAAVVAYSWYITVQISGLRALQNDLAGRNRKDSLQLLRIQNDLNSLALAMRDMLDNDEPYPLTAWSAQFQRIRADLDDAGPKTIPGQLDRSILGRRRPHLRARSRWQGERCTHTDSGLVTGAPGGAEHGSRPVARSEQ